jgi:hypothetical protein
MIPEERPEGMGGFGSGASNRAGAVEETLKTDRVQIERKLFVFALKENPRGRFLRITEDVNGRRDTIIIPTTGLDEFKRILDEMVEACSRTAENTAPQ